MKSTYCEYILEKILSTSKVGPILALIAPSPLSSINIVNVVIFDVYYSSLYLALHYHFPRIFIIHDNTRLGSNPHIITINEYINVDS
jgi:hypothetical protein